MQVFQCLLIDGENAGEKALRDAERFVVSDQQFQTFVDRHRSVRCLVPESNTAMRYSYLILDEYVSFIPVHSDHALTSGWLFWDRPQMT